MCEGASLEASPDPSGALLFTCPTCAGVAIEPRDLPRVFGGPLPEDAHDDLPDPFADRLQGRPCPFCGAALTRSSVGGVGRGVHRCTGCGAHRFEASAFLIVRRAPRELDGAAIATDGLELELEAVRPVARASVADKRLAASEGRAVEPGVPDFPEHAAEKLREVSSDLEWARLPHDEPWSDLLGLPLAFLVATLAVSTSFGSLLATPLRIQFHELGHALVALLSGRFALPLPCGLTFVSDEPSWFLRGALATLAGLVAALAIRERRPFAATLSAVSVLAILVLAAVDAERAEALVLYHGAAGELWIAGLVIAAFHFRLPDRLRWDFLRFVALPFAAASFVDSLALWIGVRRGTARAPVGSIVGTVGDGTGDLERLVSDHGRSLHDLAESYLALGATVLLGLAAVYVAHAVPAVARLVRAHRTRVTGR